MTDGAVDICLLKGTTRGEFSKVGVASPRVSGLLQVEFEETEWNDAWKGEVVFGSIATDGVESSSSRRSVIRNSITASRMRSE